MKIYCVDGTPAFSQNQLDDLNSLGEVVYIQKNHILESELISSIKDVDILIAAPGAIPNLNSNIINSLPNLKFITIPLVGYNWIDIDTAKARGIVISNVKGANSESVAEHIWGMILDLSKRISEFDRDIRQKQAYEFSNYKGHEVFGKTIGLIGTGDIGTKVARIARAFNMKILGFNKSGNQVDDITLTDLNTLLSESDIVNISIPLNDDTQDFISTDQIKLMKSGAILINCAREELVNKSAVIDAIRTKKIAGYGIETKILTPILPEDDYLQYPNILVNAHNAFNTVESDENCYGLVIENIKNYIAGKPQNLI